jgi:diguanylate cyclase (GGDEF)-like protein/PAS domain S-box-containing protein
MSSSELEGPGSASRKLDDRLQAIEQHVHGLYEHAPFGAYCTDASGVFTSINATQLDWLGRPAQVLLGKHRHSEFLTTDSQARLLRHAALYGQHGFAGLELEMLGANGQARPVAMTSMPLAAAEGQVVGSKRFILFDLSERVERLRQQRIAALAFNSAASICITNAEGVILEANEAFSALTGYSIHELRGQRLSLLHSGAQDQSFYAAMWATLRRQGVWQGEIRDRRKDGSEFIAWLSISTIRHAVPERSHHVGILYDITRAKARDAEISRLAFFDSLTHLPNRQLFQDQLEQALVALQRSSLHGALLFVDMDNFKSLNDTQGHAAGDELLIEVGRRLRSCVRQYDSVARLGGDEFVILLVELSGDLDEAASQANAIGRKILAQLEQPYRIRSHPFVCTASVGVSVFGAGETPSNLLKQADLAMYEAKKLGRNSLCFFNPAMQSSINARARVEQALVQALARQEFELHFQPQFDTRFRIFGVEALLRWRHPEQGLLTPAHFLETAEESGLMVPIGNWVIDAACQQLASWTHDPLLSGLTLSANISARQLARPEFVEKIRSALNKTGADPHRLVIELTETTVHDVDDIRLKMLELEALGISFSMDDFGKGYSSLMRLIELPIRELKIDLSFVQGAELRASARVIVETIIGMAHTLKLELIAEGVETPRQMQYLQAAGCRRFQGFLLSPAVPAAMLAGLALQRGTCSTFASDP